MHVCKISKLSITRPKYLYLDISRHIKCICIFFKYVFAQVLCSVYLTIKASDPPCTVKLNLSLYTNPVFLYQNVVTFLENIVQCVVRRHL